MLSYKKKIKNYVISADFNECQPCWETESLSAVQQISHHLWSRNVHCPFQKRMSPPPSQLHLPTLVLHALTHFTFWASALILSSTLSFCLPDYVAPSSFRPELFSVNTSKGFHQAQHSLLQRWLISAHFWAIIRRPKLTFFVINCVVPDCTAVDTFIDLSATGLRHISKIVFRRKIPEDIETILWN
jgi:hypothetical protein